MPCGSGSDLIQDPLSIRRRGRESTDDKGEGVLMQCKMVHARLSLSEDPEEELRRIPGLVIRPSMKGFYPGS
jgi:hypothetical protein